MKQKNNNENIEEYENLLYEKNNDIHIKIEENEKINILTNELTKMKEEDKNIYYACGESIDKIDLLPQVEILKDKGYEILYLTDNVDEFVFQVLNKYEEKTFQNACADNLDLDSNEEKEELKKENEENKEEEKNYGEERDDK